MLSEKHNITRSWRWSPLVAVTTLVLCAIVPQLRAAQPTKPFEPQIPKADRYQMNRVFIEHADSLLADEQVSSEYQVLKGNVRFRRADMYMYCDSAHFYDKTSSLDAFGNVRMTQGDTLFVYADVLHYIGEVQLAQLRHHVRLENRNAILLTDSLDYDVQAGQGYYFDGGVLRDDRNETELVSRNGRYDVHTKIAEFVTDVRLLNEQYEMNTNFLQYNTRTHVASISEMTEIISDSSTIYTSNGWYNTSADDATLFDRSTVVARDGQTLTGDTLYYDRKKTYGEARGNVILTDTAHHVILDGDYGYHDDVAHYSFVTRNARAREFSGKDTLYLHADTLCTIIEGEDSLRLLRAFNKVKFYRVDVQGMCDSMQVSEGDSILRLFKQAVIWSDDRQIVCDEINVHFNDSTVDWATLPLPGIVVSHVGERYYDQLSGKRMTATFENGEMRRLDVTGNVMAIMYPQENDSTYNKMVNAESGYMTLLLKPKQEVEKLTMWPEVTGQVTPLFQLKSSQMFLPQFVWYEDKRPLTPDDIFPPVQRPVRVNDIIDSELSDELTPVDDE